MEEVSVEQVRNFRLRSHHLDARRPVAEVSAVVGACGMQNTPPGAWETALFNRVAGCRMEDTRRLLEEERTLVQAWSFRGTPVVFPVADSEVFLSALVPEGGEPWIYTKGIGLALDYMGMEFDELLELLKRVLPQLDDAEIVSKVALDQTLGDWMLPLLPVEKRAAWGAPSMYGSPDKQTVGGAVVSFLLRPCAFEGLVVFGARRGASPTFTSFKRWTGHALEPSADAQKRLVRKYLHCYGPATPTLLAAWLGCSGVQARRLWQTVADELVPVSVSGKRAWVLAADAERLVAAEPLEREVLLLGGHDPYLDQRDRAILQADVVRQRRIWQTVSNPGAIVRCGEVVGTWVAKKKPTGLAVEATVWDNAVDAVTVRTLAAEYAAFRECDLVAFEMRAG